MPRRVEHLDAGDTHAAVGRKRSSTALSRKPDAVTVYRRPTIYRHLGKTLNNTTAAFRRCSVVSGLTRSAPTSCMRRGRPACACCSPNSHSPEPLRVLARGRGRGGGRGPTLRGRRGRQAGRLRRPFAEVVDKACAAVEECGRGVVLAANTGGGAGKVMGAFDRGARPLPAGLGCAELGGPGLVGIEHGGQGMGGLPRTLGKRSASSMTTKLPVRQRFGWWATQQGQRTGPAHSGGWSAALSWCVTGIWTGPLSW